MGREENRRREGSDLKRDCQVDIKDICKNVMSFYRRLVNANEDRLSTAKNFEVRFALSYVDLEASFNRSIEKRLSCNVAKL